MSQNDPDLHKSFSLYEQFRKIEYGHKERTLAIKILGVALCLWMIKGCFQALAGQKTDVSLSLLIDTIVDIKVLVSVALALTGIGWGFFERALRHRKTAYLSARITKLEQAMDEKRSSSGLTPTGRTNPADKE